MVCMLAGLHIGKKVLLFTLKGGTGFRFATPRTVVLFCCLLQVGVLLLTKNVLLKTQRSELSATTGFVYYSILFGALNGLLIGICYQAPLFAA